ncbi:MAG: AAA family ATPase, partial [Thermoplasmata archaeon]
MTGWAERYRPKDLDDVVGNPTAVAELRKWAASWQRGRPEKRAVILQGSPGIGKTSAALALANEMGWTVVEMNASDARNAEAIRNVATRGAVLQTFSDTGEFLQTTRGGRKLIILDEADNVFGREDKGGIAAIVETIQQSRQPVALIANDYYALTRRSSTLKRLCRTIKFQGIHEDA